MSPLCYLLVTVPITAPIKSTPHITKYPNQSNIYDRAQPGRDNGVCKFLGNTTSFDACSERCLKYKGPADELCHSFSWNDNKWMPTWAGMCFGITDHEWHLYDGGCTGDNTANVCISSGRIDRTEAPCGPGSFAGCVWQADPICLDTAGKVNGVLEKLHATVTDAELVCSARAECLGFTYVGGENFSRSTPIDILLTNTTDMIRGGGSGCTSHRKFFATNSSEGDPYRTTMHFQPPFGWMNDPNGPMFYRGLYHLFWQWNPEVIAPASAGGFANMHWGHAVSKDLLSWKLLPIALYPDSGSCGGEWSGSATIDAPTDAGGPVVLSYSVQCNSYFGQAVPTDPSDPMLRSWSANHVVGHKAPATGGFRDPSKAWKGTDGVWRQLLACGGASCLYNSSDFKSWAYVKHAAGTGIGPTWEMPDIELLPTIGGTNDLSTPPALFYKVGMENGTSYWTTGHFDEENNTFIVDDNVFPLGDPRQRADYGQFYSSKTFSGAPELTLIGWVGEEGGPLREWAGIQSIPRVITRDPEHPGRVLFNPIAAITALRESPIGLPPQTLTPNTTVRISSLNGLNIDIEANFSGPFVPGQQFGLGVAGIPSARNSEVDMCAVKVIIGGSDGWATLQVGPHSGQFPLPLGVLKLRVLVDRSVVEAFAGEGRAVITRRIYPNPADVATYIINEGTKSVKLDGLNGYALKAPASPSEDALLAASAAASRGKHSHPLF